MRDDLSMYWMKVQEYPWVFVLCCLVVLGVNAVWSYRRGASFWAIFFGSSLVSVLFGSLLFSLIFFLY